MNDEQTREIVERWRSGKEKTSERRKFKRQKRREERERKREQKCSSKYIFNPLTNRFEGKIWKGEDRHDLIGGKRWFG